jgi:hypothetical protein
MVNALLRDNNHYCNHAFVPVPRRWFVGLATEPTLHDSIPLVAADALSGPCQQSQVSVQDRSNGEKKSFTAAERFAHSIFS